MGKGALKGLWEKCVLMCVCVVCVGNLGAWGFLYRKRFCTSLVGSVPRVSLVEFVGYCLSTSSVDGLRGWVFVDGKKGGMSDYFMY